MFKDMNVWDYLWLGRGEEESRHQFFIKKKWEDEYRIYEYSLVSQEDQDNDAWERVDLREKWISEVSNWDTEDSFNEWRDNVDIWDYINVSDMYDCPYTVEQQLDEQWFCRYWDYPDYYWDYELTSDIFSRVSEEECNKEAMQELKKEFHLNEMTFIQTLPIR